MLTAGQAATIRARLEARRPQVGADGRAWTNMGALIAFEKHAPADVRLLLDTVDGLREALDEIGPLMQAAFDVDARKDQASTEVFQAVATAKIALHRALNPGHTTACPVYHGGSAACTCAALSGVSAAGASA